MRTHSVGVLRRRRIPSREYGLNPADNFSNGKDRDLLAECLSNKAPSALHEKVVHTLRREKDNISRAFTS